MTITLTELQQKLALIDEISVMEILEITSEDLANRFMDKIEIKYDQLITEFEDIETQSDDTWWDNQDTQEELFIEDDY
jgi:hypothetical protein